MEPKQVNIWYDPEGDFLEVMWEDKSGDFVETKDGQAHVKIDDDGNVLGFQILALRELTVPLEVALEYTLYEEPAGQTPS